jgi:hypothetical protein
MVSQVFFVSKYDYDYAAYETDKVNVLVVYIVHMVRKQIIIFKAVYVWLEKLMM